MELVPPLWRVWTRRRRRGSASSCCRERSILSNDISPDCFYSWILIVRTVSLEVEAYLVSHVTPIQIGLRQRGECRQGLIAAIMMFSNALMGRDSGL